ncbi:glycerophosphodiester phosphodiesterase family protein [Anaerosporobacter faecicola]|uniref:glycerophosphodiester phosphodiesterase family protein n=1 Tax=Anaerosporobacter faecicola TaxID=2718714 RepID=UPI001438754C|nr:glycerophosphodiester phosphodiesterase family protein [Anaerosporobacter faecicola]
MNESIVVACSVAGILVILYLLMIMPKLHKSSDEAFQGWMFAHRGLFHEKEGCPENSLPAFRNAIKNAYGIELDVQLTKDDVIVVFHDYSLKRMCGVDRQVRELTYKEISQYTLRNSICKIPTFEEVLHTIQGAVPIIVELKIEHNYEKTCRLVDAMLSTYKGVYCIESFNPLGLLWYRKHNPKVMRGQLSSMLIKDKEKGNKILYFFLQNLMLNWLAKPDFIAYNYHYRKSLSFQVCSKLYRPYTFAWTVRSEEARKECEGYFQYIIFDHFLPKK